MPERSRTGECDRARSCLSSSQHIRPEDLPEALVEKERTFRSERISVPRRNTVSVNDDHPGCGTGGVLYRSCQIADCIRITSTD